MLGMLTPPVALAAFAAATIAKSDQWKTGWTATRMGWCAYFIPFMFVYTPALVMNDTIPMVVLHFALVMVGIFIGTVAVVGHCFAPVRGLWRIGYAAVALMLLVQPAMFAGAAYVVAAGAALAVVVLAREVLRGRARPAAA